MLRIFVQSKKRLEMLGGGTIIGTIKNAKRAHMVSILFWKLDVLFAIKG
jgi:hypothetical protein